MYKKFALGAVTLLLAGSLSWGLWPQQDSPELGQGDVQTLSAVIANWNRQHETHGGAENLRFALANAQNLSHSSQHGHGDIRFNLITGELTAKAQQLAPQQRYELWLSGITKPASSSLNYQLIGTLQSDAAGIASGTVKLDRARLDGFTLDSVVITAAGQTPQSHALLAGTPSFLQRLYYSDKPWAVAQLNTAPSNSQQPAFAFLLPKVAMAHGSTTLTLAEKIAKGRKLFVDEKFNGNGRTCGTCHRPDNNHTIDPVYIATLPKNDPLFVAETNPALAGLENPKLLRQFGLILANADGFDKPPVFRSVPHTLGLGTSVSPEFIDFLGATHDESTGEHTHEDGTVYDLPLSNHMVGWSGDGSPGDGTLRSFAIGAITQHATKTLNRVAGVDFRLPTADELDAMEAYMLSLGRSADINLEKMHFNSALVEKGKALFNSDFDDGTGKCRGCHINAGANASISKLNGNRNNGIENQDLHPARLVAPEIAYDGGFGKVASQTCGPNKDATCYGDGRFNISALIEAADTPPYFHNNSVATLEEAIAFYNSVAFNTSPGAKAEDQNNHPRLITLDSSKVTAIASFLRAINVLENIRNSSRLDERALSETGKAFRETVRLAMADTEDGIQVLQQGYNLYPEALSLMDGALKLEKKYTKAALKKALVLKQQARALIVTEDN
ncbi:MAG: hypothetical protein NTV43_05015 [Methylococcales bacterium]|nr:hypothetical protein [Methylococcales bacterium]